MASQEHVAERRHRSHGVRRADVGILTVLSEEIVAVVDLLQNHPGFRAERHPGGWETFHATVPVGCGALGVVATRAPGPGPRAAAVAFGRLRDTFEVPRVLVVGVARGVRRGLRTGDVVIADGVVHHDTRPGRNRAVPPATLAGFARRYPAGVPLPDGGSVRVLHGPIGVDSHEANVLAVETEAGRVGRAFYEHVEREAGLRGWLTVRGISDLADVGGGHDRRQFAADNAALVADRLLPLMAPSEGAQQ